MIVARHEVPGTARYDSCPCAHRFEDLREEISNAVSLRPDGLTQFLWRGCILAPLSGRPLIGVVSLG